MRQFQDTKQKGVSKGSIILSFTGIVVLPNLPRDDKAWVIQEIAKQAKKRVTDLQPPNTNDKVEISEIKFGRVVSSFITQVNVVQ